MTSLNDLYITGQFKCIGIKSDPRALQEYERMRAECPIEPLCNAGLVSNDTLTITLLNTRSLHRHALDIAHDKELLNTDVLCLTETQLVPNQHTNVITEVLHHFEFCHNKCDDKFQSLSFCYKPHIEVLRYHHSIGISLLELTKSSFLQDSIRLLLIYRKNNSCLTFFYDTLMDWIYCSQIMFMLF